MPHELLDHRTGHCRRQQRLATGNDPDCSDDLLGWCVFEHEAARTGPQCVVHVGVQTERRQDQDARVRVGADDPAGRFDAIEHRHANVHEDDVRSQPARRSGSVFTVHRLSHYRKLGFSLEDLPQPDANERLVVGDENRRHRIGSTTLTAKPPLGPRLASKRPP